MRENLRITKDSTISAMQIQVGGEHYKNMAIGPLEYALANDLGPCEHCIIKYVSRYKNKGGVEDLRKARHYLDILIERECNG